MQDFLKKVARVEASTKPVQKCRMEVSFSSNKKGGQLIFVTFIFCFSPVYPAIQP